MQDSCISGVTHVNVQRLMLALSAVPSFSLQNDVKASQLLLTKPIFPSLECSQKAMMKLFCHSLSVRHMLDGTNLCALLRTWCIVTFSYNKYFLKKMKQFGPV